MNDNLNKEVKKLRPFTRFIYTIGELPSSYLFSMTYEEQLIWLCNYLATTVIPTVNNNGEAIEELQNLYIQLKEYVDNYFKNLDIQEEINNKLDEMAESGELADIIAQYLEVASILGFDTKADLKNADNLIEGSITRTIGTDTYNDGKGHYYKIRTITSSDIIDDDNILALSQYPTLIAEKIPDYFLNKTKEDLENEITDLDTELNNEIEKTNNLIKNNINVKSFSNTFGVTNITELSNTGHKYIEPFVVYDKDNNKYLMFFSDCTTNNYAIKRAESTTLSNWIVIDNNVINNSPINRHKFNILCNVKGEPVKINNKYHAYAVSGTPKKIYHYETENLTSKWNETGVALNYNNDSTDNYGVDAPCAIYDEINKKFILYYMGLSSTTNTSYINRSEGTTPSEFEFIETILSPTTNTWYSGWLGGMQLLQTIEGIKVIFNASTSTPSSAGAEPDPSCIGLGTMNDLYSNIIPNSFPSIIPVPDSINANSVWRAHIIFNPIINKYVMFYNAGGVIGDEVITYAINDYDFFEDNAYQFLTVTTPVLIGKCIKHLTPGLHNIRLGLKCAIDNVTGMKEFKVKIKVSTDPDLSRISDSDSVIMERNVFIGNYAYQNDMIYIDVCYLQYVYNYKKIYATIELPEGSITSNPRIHNVRFYMTSV